MLGRCPTSFVVWRCPIHTAVASKPQQEVCFNLYALVDTSGIAIASVIDG
jgi:hypothetical protein